MNSKSTDLFNERQASLALAQELAQNKRDDLRAQNLETIKEEEQNKQDKNSEFWYRIRWVLNIVALILLARVVLIIFS